MDEIIFAATSQLSLTFPERFRSSCGNKDSKPSVIPRSTALIMSGIPVCNPEFASVFEEDLKTVFMVFKYALMMFDKVFIHKY